MSELLNSKNYAIGFVLVALLCLIGSTITHDWNWITGFVVGITFAGCIKRITEDKSL